MMKSALSFFLFVVLICNLDTVIAMEHVRRHSDSDGSKQEFDSIRPKSISDESLFQLESTWKDQSGRKLILSHFRGKPSVIAMIYTGCQAVCPVIIADIQRIEKGLSSGDKSLTQFILVSFDSVGDTSETLTKFAKKHSLDLNRWVLLTGGEVAVRDLAAVLGIKYKKDAGVFSHSNVITVLDSDGVIRFQQLGLRQDPKLSINAISNANKLVARHPLSD